MTTWRWVAVVVAGVLLVGGLVDGARVIRRNTRGGRQKGCYVYIAAEQLARAGYDPSGPAPFYRVWPSSHGGLFVRLYKEA